MVLFLDILFPTIIVIQSKNCDFTSVTLYVRFVLHPFATGVPGAGVGGLGVQGGAGQVLPGVGGYGGELLN